MNVVCHGRPVAEQEALDREIAHYNDRLVADHGIPAVLHGVPDGGYQQRGTLVRITEPGSYYLHLIQAADGRMWAGFTRSSSSYEVVSEEELEVNRGNVA